MEAGVEALVIEQSDANSVEMVATEQSDANDAKMASIGRNAENPAEMASIERNAKNPAKIVSTDLNAGIRTTFAIAQPDLRTYSPLTLAFIGDAVYELLVRSVLVDQGNAAIGSYNDRKKQFVSAEGQAKVYRRIEPLLTEEEKDVCRRGRNAKPRSVAKNASLSSYHTATGVETLFGYLYLDGKTERMLELLSAGLR